MSGLAGTITPILNGHSGSFLRNIPLSQKIMFAIAAVGIFAFGYHWGNRYARPKMNDLAAYALAHPVKIKPFELRDKLDSAFTVNDFKAHWNWIMVGDLNDAGCKTLLQRYVLAWNYLASSPQLQSNTRVVFIDVRQPAKTAQQLRAGINFFHPGFTAAGGAWPQLGKLISQLGINLKDRAALAHCTPDQTPVALVGPNAYLIALFGGVTDPARIAADLQSFN